MFSLISAAIGSFYCLEVLFFAVLTYLALDWSAVQRLFETADRKSAITGDVTLSIVKELSLQIIVGKWLFIKIVSFLGGFPKGYTLSWLMYFIDYATMAGLCVVYSNMLKERKSAEEAMLTIDPQAKPIPSFIHASNLRKCLNPYWVSNGIKLHPNITYSTNEEKNEALTMSNQDFDQPRKMMLDVYTTAKNNNVLRPVLVHIHGGGWQEGTKDRFLPFEKLMLTENNWVVVNIDYRLSPVNKYPVHLLDVKRALRWVKQNISKFGGDPKFIVLSGDSAGGHLAAMTSLTENDPKYQPGFEDVDTSVQGVVSISGVLDLGSVKRYAKTFSLDIAQLPSIDYNYLFQNSPVSSIPRAKEQNKLAPYLLIHGEQDVLVTCEMSKRFKEVYDEENGPKCDLHLVKGGSHIHYMFWSPRSFYTAHIIQAWCDQLYTKMQ